MPTYRLDPIDSTDPRWRAQSYVTECVWVSADTPGQARDLVAGRTAVARASTGPHAPIHPAPWLDESMSICVLDTSRTDVPIGIVMRVDGRAV